MKIKSHYYFFVLILITTECNNINNENLKNIKIQQIEDSLHVYENYNDLWFDTGSISNHSNEKFSKLRCKRTYFSCNSKIEYSVVKR